jgi:hypothetical protein
MTEPERRSESPASAWLSGLVLGAVSGLALLALGLVGVALLAASLLLVAAKGPRALAGAGLVAGLGLVWTVLFTRVGLSCLAPDCQAGDIWTWVAGAAVLFAVGLTGSAVALRRTRR